MKQYQVDKDRQMTYNDIEKLIYFNNNFLSELPEPNTVFNNSLCFENHKNSNTFPFGNPSDYYSLHNPAWVSHTGLPTEVGGIEDAHDSHSPLQDVREYLKDHFHDGLETEVGRRSSNLSNHSTPQQHIYSETPMDRALQSNNSICNILPNTFPNPKIAMESHIGYRQHPSDTPVAKENRCFLLATLPEKTATDEPYLTNMKQRSACIRHYLPHTPIHPMFPSFYSELPKLALFPLPKHPFEEDVKYIKYCPIDDYYLPRYTRGQGKKKEGLCPICCLHKSFVWLRTKTSAYWYHMNFLHGIHSKGRPYHPPIEFRTIPVRKVKSIIGLPDRRQIVQGKCHQCNRWVRCQGTYLKKNLLSKICCTVEFFLLTNLFTLFGFIH
ncbi:DUF4451 family conserved fungal protein [Schizosaccharomyces osmophilus]|uniref:DUF4451 family conserved fungal protein n=1 Tax=Schizosaccharomyces osmophilus TaxID=2545709 RepID=A0AAF0AXA6_9SCHI|nr:DUF4451 family conserved fungal protein [Schizosaccharomyces osmophilus]WBW73910.1 DUF4451 family conserved fungal protein [Schizosaccharomyces osmophilus]